MRTKPKRRTARTFPALSRCVPYGPVPLLEGEDADAYDQLFAAVSGAVKPSDTIEEIWMYEIVCHTWESWRWRRFRDAYIKAQTVQALKCALTPMSCHGIPNLPVAWAAGNPRAVKQVNAQLASEGKTVESVAAEACGRDIEKIQQFESLITAAEARRDALLREIELRRERFGRNMRREIQTIEETESKSKDKNTALLNSAGYPIEEVEYKAEDENTGNLNSADYEDAA